MKIDESVILERIDELTKSYDWCIYQLTDENRLNRCNNPNSIQVWVNSMVDKQSRIEELKSLIKLTPECK